MQKSPTNNNPATDLNISIVSVIGRVDKEREYSLGELLEMDKIETEEMRHACGSGDPKGLLPGCTGVLLTDIINGTDVTIIDHNDTKRMYVVVYAVDGYCTVFSWQELFNSAVGEGVMVILEKDSEKIYKKHGRVDLFSSKDFLTGPRYVKQVATIKIIMVGE